MWKRNTWVKFKEWLEGDSIKEWLKSVDWVNIIVYLSVLGVFAWDMRAANISMSTRLAPVVALFIFRGMLWENAYRKKIKMLEWTLWMERNRKLNEEFGHI